MADAIRAVGVAGGDGRDLTYGRGYEALVETAVRATPTPWL